MNAAPRQYQNIILALCVTLFCAPLFSGFGALGINDWDHHLFYYGSFLKSFSYGQMPFWNPWYCGGSVLWQNPQIPVLSPAYLLALILPLQDAMRLNIYLHYLIAMGGCVWVGREIFGIRTLPGVLVGSAFFVFNGFFVLQIVEGHTWILSFALMPFAFLFLYRATHRAGRKPVIGLGIVLAAMILSSSIYPALYTLMLLSGYALFQKGKNRGAALKALGIGVALMVGLSAVKLLPVLDFSKDYPRATPHEEVVSLSAVDDIFVGRRQKVNKRNLVPLQYWGWHEYGCFLGWVLCLGLLFSVGGALRSRSREDIFHLSLLVFFFLIFFGKFSPYAPYAWFDFLPVLKSLRVPTRSLIVLSFVFTLLVFKEVSRWEEWVRLRPKCYWPLCGILVLGLVDVFLVNTPNFSQAFSRKVNLRRYPINPTAREYRVERSLASYGAYSALYPGLVNNIATESCHGPQKPKKGYLADKPLVYSPQPETVIENLQFSPNRVTFSVRSLEGSQLILNQNYIRGWSFEGTQATEKSRQPTALLKAGNHSSVSFSYTPPRFYLGLVLSLLTGAFLFFYGLPDLGKTILSKVRSFGNSS